MIKASEQRNEITLKVMELFDVVKPNENHLVTLRKAHNKFVFDKKWFDQILRLEEDHNKQMAIIVYNLAHRKEYTC